MKKNNNQGLFSVYVSRSMAFLRNKGYISDIYAAIKSSNKWITEVDKLSQIATQAKCRKDPLAIKIDEITKLINILNKTKKHSAEYISAELKLIALTL